MECLEERIVLSLNMTVTITIAHDIQVTEGTEVNNLTVNYDPLTNTYQFTDTATPQGTVTFVDNSGDASDVNSYIGTSGIQIKSNNPYPNLSIDQGGGTNSVQVNAESSATTITSNSQTVNLGSGNLSALVDAVTVNAGAGTAVTLDDTSGAGGTYALDGTTVSAPGFGGLSYSTLASLALNTSNTGSTINLNQTAAGVSTTVTTGSGGSTVNVLATTGSLNVVGGGADTVNVGSTGGAGSLTSINGPVSVSNPTHLTSLTLHDENDTIGRSVSLTNDGTNGQVTGLSPAMISYVDAGTGSLTVNGGSGNNAFAVNGTLVNNTVVPTPTTLNKGTGNFNSVSVLATNAGSTLTINGQGGIGSTDAVSISSSATVLGSVAINELNGGLTALTIDLSTDGLAHNFSLSSNGTTSTLHDALGNLPQDITYVTADLSSLTLNTDPALNQSLNIDFSQGGNPIPTGSVGLMFNADGVSGASAPAGVTHTLNLHGQLQSGAFASETHNANDPAVGPTVDQYGSIIFTDAGGNQTGIDYTGLLPITDTAPAVNYTFNDFADDQSFTATSTLIGATPAIQFANTPTAPPPTFETTDIANKTNVVFNTPNIHTGAGLNGVVNIPAASAGLSNLTFNTPTTGDNQVVLLNTPSGVVTSLNGGPEEDLTSVTGLGVASGTVLFLNGGGSTNTLNYDAGGLTPTITPGLLPGEVLITIPSAGTVDAVNYQAINITDTTPLVFTAGPAVTVNSVEGFQLVNQTVATFTAPVGITGFADFPASAFTASLDWGDPSPNPSAGTISQDASNPSVYYITGNHTFASNGTYTVANTVAFAGGMITAPVNGVPVTIAFAPSGPTTGTSATANVTHGPLAVSAFPIVGTEGVAIAAGPVATFIDAGGADLIGDYSATIAILDSSGATVVSVPAASITQNGTAAQYTVNAPAFTLPEEGTYQVLVTVTDTAGAAPITVSGASTAVIADATLTAGAATLLTPNTGVPLPATTVVGTFTDANTAAPISDFRASIDWGDGSPISTGVVVATGGGGFSVLGGHTYAKPGVYTTLITVIDQGGAQVIVTGSSTVTDLPVTGTVRNFQAVEGQDTGTIVLGTFEDPNTLATVANVQATLPVGGWGDGTPTGVVTLAVTQIGVDPANGQPIFQITGSHTYADEGTFTVNINVTTSGGVTTALTPGTATVVDAALSSSNGTEITGFEGTATAASTLLGTFTDANQGATVADFTTAPGSVVVNWGDGSAPETLAAANLTAIGTPNGVVFSVTAPHTYATAGTYAYTVTVTDLGGAVTIFSGSAIIAAPPLTPVPGTQPTVNTIEAGIFPLPVYAPMLFHGPVAAFMAGPSTALPSIFTATIDWGDGTPLTAGTISQPGGSGTSYVVSGSHTYADAGVNGGTGTYAIQVFVTVNGSTLTIANTANVADRPIALAGALNPASDSGKYNNDGITNVAQPNFYGTSEPFSHVTLDANGTVIGQTQAGSDGSWSITSNHLADGSYAITATAVDQFGMTTTTAPVTITPNLVIDTVGPRITYAGFDRFTGTVYYTVQDVLGDGATPGGSGLLIQSLSDAANYSLNRVHTRPPGTYIVTDITVTAGTTPDSQDIAVVFNNGESLRGGYFQIIARAASAALPSGIQDLAGNALDGEFYGQQASSGNGVRGGDFVANITSLHHAASPHGYSGPITILGTPHPNDPAGNYPPPKSHTIRKQPAVPVKTAPVRTAPVKSTQPVKVSLPKRTLTISKTTRVKNSTPAPTKTSAPLSLSQWSAIRSRMLGIAAKAQRG